MEKEFFLLDLPTYNPVYDVKKIYGHSTERRRQNTVELLTKTSRGYCMYCYNRILVNGNNYGHIEHGIEKANTERLIDCVPNLGLACNKCNQSYKGKGERKRKLTKSQIKKLETCTCKSQKCKSMCASFSYCRDTYARKWKIILQPFGIESKSKVPYKIQFNLLTGEYIVSTAENYEIEDRKFIEKHINFFGLNDVQRRNKELGIYCKNVIAEKSVLKGITLNHLVVELFRERLESISIDKAVKVCQIVYTLLLQGQYT